jgi:serine/threonine protein kinase
MKNTVISISNKIDQKLHDKIINLKINVEKRIQTRDNLIIKILDEHDEDSEVFLIKKYLASEFESPNFIDYYGIIKFDESIGIVMPIYPTLIDYLSDNKLPSIILLQNLISIIDMNIYTRDNYNFLHFDIKIHNILFKNNTFYLIDWEKVIKMDETYDNRNRPGSGNTEMYPHYNTNAEQFFIYSMYVLIVRIIGYNYDVSYLDFVKNYKLDYILSKIPLLKLLMYEKLIVDIYNRKLNKIEELKERLKEILLKVELEK